jgi:hypothetical protein
MPGKSRIVLVSLLSFAAGTGGEGKEGNNYGSSIPAVNDGPSAPYMINR